jgi:hypothetical protein
MRRRSGDERPEPGCQQRQQQKAVGLIASPPARKALRHDLGDGAVHLPALPGESHGQTER